LHEQHHRTHSERSVGMSGEFDQQAWEEALIADMREHDGRPTNGPLEGHPLLLMYVAGAKTGERRRTILTYSRDGDDYVVAGTAGGSPHDPAWIANVQAHPDVEVEIGMRSFAAVASVAQGADRGPLWDQHVAALPWFADYPAQTGREIPMVRLTAKPADAA
jgi:deazaflavin-dependent oxidoreductase (nitroreductase family)